MMKILSGELRARHALLPGAVTLAAALAWGGGAFSGERGAIWTADEQSWEIAMADMDDAGADQAGRVERAKRPEELFLGRAPWICTPSGFGQTASCFRRSEIRLGSND